MSRKIELTMIHIKILLYFFLNITSSKPVSTSQNENLLHLGLGQVVFSWTKFQQERH